MSDEQPIKPLTLADINIRTFMRCLFNHDYTGVPNWEELYTLYVDLSGIAKEGELGMMTAIHNLNIRLVEITGWLEYQQKYFSLTGFPDIDNLDNLRKYGHRVTADLKTFEQQLLQVEGKEKKNISQMNKLNKELAALQAIKQPETVNARNSFLTMLNVLGKSQGYAINKDSTDMEELSVMIKEHNEQARLANNN